jgi:hypothetical protein
MQNALDHIAGHLAFEIAAAAETFVQKRFENLVGGCLVSGACVGTDLLHGVSS